MVAGEGLCEGGSSIVLINLQTDADKTPVRRVSAVTGTGCRGGHLGPGQPGIQRDEYPAGQRNGVVGD